MSTNDRPTGVLLMTMGDVPDLPGVFPFLVRLFSDPSIIRAPWFVRYPLSVYIAVKKLPTMLARYRAIGGGSPMNRITRMQADALEKRLNESGNFRVYVANRYCAPSTASAYKAMKKDGVGRIVALPLYPHYTTATTASNFAELESLIKKDKGAPEVVWVRSFASDPAFVSVFTRRITEALEALPDGERMGAEFLFSAHSLPHEFIKQGDPYLDEIRGMLAGVIKVLKPAHFHLCFQSKGGGKREWLKPETDEILKGLAEKGRESVVVVPVSFVAENIETLYDVDVMYREMAGRLGIKKFIRVRCLDDDPEFIDALAGIVARNV